MSNEGLKSLDEIWESINDDDGLSDAPAEEQVIDDTGSEPVSQVDEGLEQSDDEFIPAKLSDLYAQTDADGQGENAPVDLEQEYVLGDGTRVTLGQLINERLMREDYTRKTQELSSERTEIEKSRAELQAAAELRDSLVQNPVATIAQMAVSLGIIDEDTAAYAVSRKTFNGDPNTLIPKGKQPEVDIEALVEQKAAEKLEALLKNNPAIKQIEIQQARQQTDQIFNQIQQVYGTELDLDDRRTILQASLDMNEDNLEYVYLKLTGALKQRQAQANRVKGSSTPKSVRGSQPNDADIVTTPPDSFEEAWRRTSIALGV